jgi:hypothetical protein
LRFEETIGEYARLLLPGALAYNAPQRSRRKSTALTTGLLAPQRGEIGSRLGDRRPVYFNAL